jgi:hypothetical protein
VPTRHTSRLVISLEGLDDTDEEELESLTNSLRQQLLELDVDSVEIAPEGNTPANTKAAHAIAIGTLLVSVGIPVIKRIFELLKTWIEHRPVRNIKVSIGDDSIELQAASRSDQKLLIDAFTTKLEALSIESATTIETQESTEV